MYLSPYSPDLNPIKVFFAEIATPWRKPGFGTAFNWIGRAKIPRARPAMPARIRVTLIVMTRIDRPQEG